MGSRFYPPPFLLWIILSLCSPVLFGFEFTPCTTSNDYLEEQLKTCTAQKCEKEASTFPEIPAVEALSSSEMNLSCLAVSMSRFSEKGSGYSYKKCTSSKSTPTQVERPCISRSYVSHILDRYQAVSRCAFHGTTIGPQETFPLIAHESGFHLNVSSGTYCRGLGQLSRIAVHEMDQIDQRDLEKKEKPYSRSSLLERPECAELQQTLTAPIPDHSKKLEDCEVMVLPQNPDLNLLYSLRLYRMLKEVKAGPLISELKTKWPKLDWKDHDLSILQVRLAQIMYNGGYTSIASNFRTFLATIKPSALPNEFKGDFLWNRFETYIGIYYPNRKPDRKKEVQGYVDKIEKTKVQIQERAGVECFSESR